MSAEQQKQKTRADLLTAAAETGRFVARLLQVVPVTSIVYGLMSGAMGLMVNNAVVGGWSDADFEKTFSNCCEATLKEGLNILRARRAQLRSVGHA